MKAAFQPFLPFVPRPPKEAVSAGKEIPAALTARLLGD
jgi:hypothetical protein